MPEYEGEYYSDELKATYGVYYVDHDRVCLKAPIVPDVFQLSMGRRFHLDSLLTETWGTIS